jgi:hypothetical protein
MATLTKSSASIELTAAKTSGLHSLGVPVDASTQAKKGKLQEFLQTLDTGTIARRYQNIRITMIKAGEGGRVFSKIIIQFEVFADDWTSTGDNAGIDLALCKEGKSLHDIHQPRLFLPYCRSWYENQFEYTIPNEVFDEVEAVEFIANADEVQPG